MNSDHKLQAATKKLSVSAILFGILAGFIGVGGGLILGFALGAALAAALHVSPMEGGAGYFAISIALIVTLIVTPSSILVMLYWRGIRGLWLLAGLIAVCFAIVAIAASGFGLWYAGQPHILNTNGPTPLLELKSNRRKATLSKVSPASRQSSIPTAIRCPATGIQVQLKPQACDLGTSKFITAHHGVYSS